MYEKIGKGLNIFFKTSTIIKHLFNLSPMYRRSCGRIVEVSEDITYIKIRIKKSYKNQNYNGSIFGGSLYSATDPIYMIQYLQILGSDYVVWDKSATIKFKRPAYKSVFGEFIITLEEIDSIKEKLKNEKEITYHKSLNLVDEKGIVHAEVYKEIYIAEKKYYLEKIKAKKLAAKI